MKKSRIVVSLIIIAAILCVAFWVHSYHEKKNAERMHELEILYKHQNTAFGMCHDNLDNRIYYHGSDEINKKFILIATIAYNRDQEKYVLTEQDIITYLDSEYDESGELRVYNRPAAIDDYIEWYYHGGDEKVDYCRSEIDHYLIKHNYTENTMEISYEKLVEVIEKYKNSDEYDYIRKKGNQATSGIELTPEILELSDVELKACFGTITKISDGKVYIEGVNDVLYVGSTELLGNLKVDDFVYFEYSTGEKKNNEYEVELTILRYEDRDPGSKKLVNGQNDN